MVKLIPSTTKWLEKFAARNRLAYRIFSLYYKRIVKKEVDLANINAADEVLCIGGGPCPFSGILLHQYTGARVTIIDNDEACVYISKELINRLGYSDYIKVVHSEGNNICPKGYSVIHLACQVSPLEKVFCNLKQKCKYGAKILVRLPKRGLAKYYYENDYAEFKTCCERVVHTFRNLDSTALFIKN